jgi:cytochrome c biogenesis protein CcdA
MGNGLIHGLGTVLSFILLAVIVLKAVVLVDAAVRREDAYRAAGKMTKQGWLIILTIALVADLLVGGITSIFTIVGTVAAIVYWVDVRPAVKQVSGKSAKNGQHMGPYGPW